jgi:hypothetical protein
MDQVIDAVTEGAVWGLACGAAMLLIKPVRRSIRPAVRRLVAGGVGATQMITDATRKGRDTLGEIYAEAAVERAQAKRAREQVSSDSA